MKKFKVELSSMGLETKTVNYNDYQWTLTQGQVIKESGLTKNFPQFFVEYVEGQETVAAPVVEEVVETVEEEVVEETPAEEVVETVEEEVVEETPAEEVVESTTDDIIAEAKTIKTKAELEEFGLTHGVDLNKQKSLRNMIKDLEAFLKGE